jgi:hypothetical protein
MTPGRRSSRRPAARCGLVAAIAGLSLLAPAGGAAAAPIANPVATFSGLDKITARLTKFDAYVGETVQFGSLQITPRACYTRPASETQRTSVFVEVDKVSLTGASRRVFTGWMFADSPALNAVDDAVYDFWLVACKQHSDVPPPKVTNPLPGPVELPRQATSAPGTSSPDAAPSDAVENGSIITLLDPNSAADDEQQ